MITTLKTTGRTIRQTVARGALFSLVTIGILLFALSRVGNWLTVSHPLPDDLAFICTFAGDGRRVEYSRELMLQYPQARWLLLDYRNGHGRLLEKGGFDMSRVHVIDTSKNTIAEILAIRSVINVLADSALHTAALPLHIGLVSSPYHMRRIKIMADRHLKQPGIQLHLLPVPLNAHDWTPDTFRYWWRSGRITSITITELSKLLYYLLTGFFYRATP
jgi:uncharacterized SAM-binding protein YcdF (DUF218 family)